MEMIFDRTMVTTALGFDGYTVKKNLGITQGLIVRSRSIIGSIGAGLQTLIGGNISLFTSLCEESRAQAFGLMLLHATEMGANAIVSFRYDTTEIAPGVTEVLAYGTAVFVEKIV